MLSSDQRHTLAALSKNHARPMSAGLESTCAQLIPAISPINQGDTNHRVSRFEMCVSL